MEEVSLCAGSFGLMGEPLFFSPNICEHSLGKRTAIIPRIQVNPKKEPMTIFLKGKWSAEGGENIRMPTRMLGEQSDNNLYFVISTFSWESLIW